MATTASVRLRPSPRLMLMLRLIPTTDTVTTDSDTAVDTPPLDTPDLATAVATLDLATEVTDTPVVTTASVRLRPSPRLMLRLIPTTDTVTPDLATTEDSATDTAVATDTLDKKVPVLQSAKAFKTS